MRKPSEGEITHRTQNTPIFSIESSDGRKNQ